MQSATTKAALLQRPAVRHVSSRKTCVKVHANSIWTLAPKTEKIVNLEKQIDLTTIISGKHTCHFASKDHASADITLDQNGVHLVFESHGTSGDLDSDAKLFVTDMEDSVCDLKVDGKTPTKGEKVKLNAGSILEIGGAQYMVLRNVFAHA